MSYILDALKRSEQARQNVELPNLASMHAAPLEAARTQGRWQWPLLAVVALAVPVAWWFGTRQVREAAPEPAHSVPAPQAAAPQAPAASATQAPASATNASQAPAGVAQVALAPPQAAPGPVSLAPAPVETSPRLKLATSIGGGAAGDAAPQAVAPEAAPPAQSGAVMAYADLPANLRKALPALSISGYAAGDAGRPMVMVDDKLLHEGEEVMPGLRVEKISPDGAVFAYKGYRFRR